MNKQYQTVPAYEDNFISCLKAVITYRLSANEPQHRKPHSKALYVKLELGGDELHLEKLMRE